MMMMMRELGMSSGRRPHAAGGQRGSEEGGEEVLQVPDEHGVDEGGGPAARGDHPSRRGELAPGLR